MSVWLCVATWRAIHSRICLEEAIQWAQDRETFGKRLADHQVIRHKIADMKMRINATEAYLQAMVQQECIGGANPGDLALLKV